MSSRAGFHPAQVVLPAMAPAGSVDVAVAIQFSGHLRDDCRLTPAALHLSACRSRFASCHAFVHTWMELEPRTPHWRRGWPSAANASSAACVRRLHSLLQPTAVAVEEQPPPPPDDSPAPDGKPFVCFECCRDDRDPEACQREAAKAQRLHWGAARHWGWRMNLRAMHRAAELRRAHEARHSGRSPRPSAQPRPSALSPRSSASTSTLHAAAVLASAKASAHIPIRSKHHPHLHPYLHPHLHPQLHYTQARSGGAYALAVRLRPDDKWRYGQEAQVAELWDCVQLLLAAPPPQRASLPARARARRGAAARGSAARRTAVPDRSPRPAEAWLHLDDSVRRETAAP